MLGFELVKQLVTQNSKLKTQNSKLSFLVEFDWLHLQGEFSPLQ
jgi:hypothetical protein